MAGRRNSSGAARDAFFSPSSPLTSLFPVALPSPARASLFENILRFERARNCVCVCVCVCVTDSLGSVLCGAVSYFSFVCVPPRVSARARPHLLLSFFSLVVFGYEKQCGRRPEQGVRSSEESEVYKVQLQLSGRPGHRRRGGRRLSSRLRGASEGQKGGAPRGFGHLEWSWQEPLRNVAAQDGE